MPKYDFKCVKCGKIEESTVNSPSPACGCSGISLEMKRIYAFAGSVLKGSGWYSVDKRRTDGGTIGIEDPT